MPNTKYCGEEILDVERKMENPVRFTRDFRSTLLSIILHDSS
jgi:hypothetical protein